MNVYLYQNNTEKILKNAYIGEVWTPGSNTLAYFPLTAISTVNDMSGNNRNLTNSGVTFGTYKGVDCAYFGGSQMLSMSSFVSNQQQITVSCWYYYIALGGSTDQFIWRWGGSSANFGPYIDNYYSSRGLKASPGGLGNKVFSSDSTWVHVLITFNGSNIVKLYVNGELNGTNSSASVPSGSVLGIGGYSNSKYRKGGISEVIVENKVRTDQGILDYYNNTKSNYGL